MHIKFFDEFLQEQEQEHPINPSKGELISNLFFQWCVHKGGVGMAHSRK